MQKSGFFNALLSNGEYDRKYNANDYCDNLAVVISNGVLRGVNDDLRVTSAGMVVTVGVGRAWINGHYYVNDTPYSFGAVSAPIGGTRYDRVFLRLNKNLSVRSVSLVYQQGTAGSNPTKPAPVRDGNIYDIVLADIFVGTNATSVTVTDTRGNASLCGWVYSTSGDNSFFTSLDAAFNTWFDEKKDTLASVTLFKRYTWRTTLTAAAKTVTFNISQYNPETSFISVYVNGILETEGADYTLNGSTKTITFTGTLIAGTEVIVMAYKSVDGTGIESISDEITALQNAVAEMHTTGEYEYICNGVDDNVQISNIIKTWLAAGTDYATFKLNVYGTLGIKAAYGGSGTSSSPYRWFEIGSGSASNRRAVVDFSACSQITINAPDDSYNTVFYGLNVTVIGAGVIASGGASITMFSTVAATQANAERCRFWITSAAGYIARGGTFRDCRATMTISAGDAYVFNVLSGGLLRIFGGEYYAYAPTGATSMIVYVNAAQTGAVVNTYSMSCPTNARSGYVQTFAVNCLTGDACCSFTDTITLLTMQADGQNIRGTIKQSKAGLI